MASWFQCPICIADYNLDVPIEQAVQLTCGHTFCRQCLTRLRQKLCPNDRTPITGDIAGLPPNYGMHAAISESRPPADPLNVEGAARLLLPAEDLVFGEVMGQGGTSIVLRGTLKGKQVGGSRCRDGSGVGLCQTQATMGTQLSVMICARVDIFARVHWTHCSFVGRLCMM